MNGIGRVAFALSLGPHNNNIRTHFLTVFWGSGDPPKQIFPRNTRQRICHDHNTSSILRVDPVGEKVNALLELFINLAEFNVMQFQFRVAKLLVRTLNTVTDLSTGYTLFI